MHFYICNNSLEKNDIFIRKEDSFFLDLNKKYKTDPIYFHLKRSISNTISFHPSILFEENELFFLIDYLFFVEPPVKKCSFCNFGFNKDTEIIISKTIQRFHKKDFSLSPFEVTHLLHENLLSNMPTFNLWYDKDNDFWYYFSHQKKILVKNPKLPPLSIIIEYLNSLEEIPFKLILSLSELLASNLDVFDVCFNCHNSKLTNNSYGLFLKLSYFDVISSNVKNIFVTDLSYSDLPLIKDYLTKKRAT